MAAISAVARAKDHTLAIGNLNGKGSVGREIELGMGMADLDIEMKTF